MIRVVLDTNIIVSAYVSELGLPAWVLRLALAGRLSLYVSEAILLEYQEVLQREHLRINRSRQRRLMALIRKASTLINPMVKTPASPDPDDVMFLACAEAAKAHYLITGNIRHFPSRWKYTKIVTPRAFIDIWKDLRSEYDLP